MPILQIVYWFHISCIDADAAMNSEKLQHVCKSAIKLYFNGKRIK